MHSLCDRYAIEISSLKTEPLLFRKLKKPDVCNVVFFCKGKQKTERRQSCLEVTQCDFVIIKMFLGKDYPDSWESFLFECFLLSYSISHLESCMLSAVLFKDFCLSEEVALTFVCSQWYI